MATRRRSCGKLRSDWLAGPIALGILVSLVSCSTGIHDPALPGGEVLIASGNTALGFDPPVELAGDEAVTESAIAAALLPGRSGEPDQQLVFFAFTTRAAADTQRPDGGTLAEGAPADVNGEGDIFLAVLADPGESSTGSGPTFTQTLFNTLRSDRCIGCHGFFADPTSLPGHSGGFNPGSCMTDGCHTREVTGLLNDPWEAPAASFDFRGKSSSVLAEMVRDLGRDPTDPDRIDPEPVRTHLLDDEKIQWAIIRGKVPFGTPNPLPTTPISFDRWTEQVNAWIDGGLTIGGAVVRSIVLVSRTEGANATGNGKAGEPDVVFVPDPAYDPGISGMMVPVGTLHVVFGSTSDDLVVGAMTSGQNIFRVRVDVFATGDPDIPVELRPGPPALVSASATGFSSGGNGSSSHPVISADGRRVAFESLATDLVPGGFLDGNEAGAPDVFVHDTLLGTTELVSASQPGMSGNGASRRPAISATGDVVAFESLASDLVFGDTNGVQDVFYTRLDPARGLALVTSRASVATGNVEATGGPSGNATVVSFGEEVLVAFESEKRDLDGRLPPGTGAQIYLHDSRDTGRTTRLSRTSTGRPGSALARDPVLSPIAKAVAFSSAAGELDSVRKKDDNAASDVFLASLSTFLDSSDPRDIKIERLSVSPDGESGNAASVLPRLTAIRDPQGGFQEGQIVSFSTQATNLGVAEGASTVVLLVEPNRSPVCILEVAGGRRLFGPMEEVSFDPGASFDPDRAPIALYRFDFDDGSPVMETNTPQVVFHAYAATGLFDPVLTVIDEKGSSRSCSVPIIVNEPPICAASGPAGVVLTNENLMFDGTASLEDDPGDAIALFSWDFGDGTGSEGPVVNHAYSTAGMFEVTLVVTDTRGASSSCSTSVEVNTPPTCSAVFPESALTLVDVTFDGRDSMDPDGDLIVEYLWSFGDGAMASGAVVTHQYATPDRYTVTLTVTDARLARSSCGGKITINTDTPPTCVASFPPTGCTRTDITFDGSMSMDQFGDPVVRYVWSFGDGMGADTMSPTVTHSYDLPGVFSVALTVFDDRGNSSIGLCGGSISISRNPPTCMAVFPSTATTGQLVSFDGSSSRDKNNQPVTGHFWTFGDTPTEFSGAMVNHTYVDPGSYTVTLRVVDARGEESTCSRNIDVRATFGYVFSNVLQPQGNNQCVNCHDPGNNLNFGSTRQNAYLSLLVSDSPPTGRAAACNASRFLVVPGNPNTSILVDKIEAARDMRAPVCGASPMPLTGSLMDLEILAIRSWILDGAKNNP